MDLMRMHKQMLEKKQLPVSSSAFAIDLSLYSNKIMRFNDDMCDEGVVNEEQEEDEDVFQQNNECIHESSLAKYHFDSKLRRQSLHHLSTYAQKPLNSNNYWSYDELNELKMKFISLLSSGRDSDETRRHSSIHFTKASPLSPDDHVKIESFYQSFGTQLYVTKSYASLYTLTLEKIQEKGGIGSVFNCLVRSDTSQIDWCVQHYGVPLWVFNTGLNPRRPCRQLKFTLAERGTGFILWQDRIDFRSEFKVLSKRNNCIYEQHQQAESIHSDRKSFVITFKASDRKSLVFIKFDFNTEISKFFEFYFKINQKLMEEMRLRTNSLPINIGNQINPKKLVKDANKLRTKLEKMQKNIPANICIVKYKRISKNDISKPSGCRHIIHIRIDDRFIYYTLSKLLPVTADSLMNSSTTSTNGTTTTSGRSSLKSNLSSTSTHFSS